MYKVVWQLVLDLLRNPWIVVCLLYARYVYVTKGLSVENLNCQQKWPYELRFGCSAMCNDFAFYVEITLYNVFIGLKVSATETNDSCQTTQYSVLC